MSAGRVLMVRPAAFGFNEQTAESNRYQVRGDELGAAALARDEHDGLVAALRRAGVDVRVLEDEPVPPKPDAVFPNNWISFHADGTVVLYPMAAPSRRRERRLAAALAAAEITPRRVVDLTSAEAQGRYLEGTGSLVLDEAARVAYACRSVRTHPGLAAEWAQELGYELVLFDAVDDGVLVYHTNVVLAIGSRFAVFAAELVPEPERSTIVARLSAQGREVVRISAAAVRGFAGNVLELEGRQGAVVVASAQARDAFGDDWARLRDQVDDVVVAPLPTIERFGGGSARCTLCEVPV